MAILAPRLIAATLLAALAGCASHPTARPAICDGRHRRPANPYGSVLPAIPGGASPNAPGADIPPPAPPGPLSAMDVRSTAPCGGGA